MRLGSANQAFEWHGVNLFEVRTYAELGRTCQLLVNSMVPAEPSGERTIYLDPCWNGGLPIPIPQGLNRFMGSSRRFVERLLLLEAISGQVRQPNIPLVDSAAFKKAPKEIEGGEQDKLPF